MISYGPIQVLDRITSFTGNNPGRIKPRGITSPDLGSSNQTRNLNIGGEASMESPSGSAPRGLNMREKPSAAPEEAAPQIESTDTAQAADSGGQPAKPGEVVDEVEWGAKFATPTEEILSVIKAPTKSGRVNSATGYRDVPAGTTAFNISKKTGRQINFGTDFAAQENEDLTSPFAGPAKVVHAGNSKLSGGGKSVTLEYTLGDGSKVYADMNHNNEVLVKAGEMVSPDQPLAKAGQTGNASGVHSDTSWYTKDENGKYVFFDAKQKFGR